MPDQFLREVAEIAASDATRAEPVELPRAPHSYGWCRMPALDRTDGEAWELPNGEIRWGRPAGRSLVGRPIGPAEGVGAPGQIRPPPRPAG